MLEPYIHLIQKYPTSFLMDYCLLVSFLSGIINFRFMDSANRAILGMIAVTLGIELVLIHYASQGSNNHFLFSLISLVTVVGMGVAFTRGAVKASEKWSVGAIVAVYSLIFASDFQWTRIVEHLLAIERLILLGFVLLYFRRMITQMHVSNMLRHAMFWNCVGIILYASASLFILLTIQFPFFNASLFNTKYEAYWLFAQWGAGFMYLVMGTAFWVRRVEVLETAI
ncbi:hypothetical protein [Tellurirhabdus rosea]|uniref:hypothetical protein n=1 Tax=Tellurirhabdus rosea TaxID=2674997 RepID=UPI002251F062|nr:hypothetical protein [Tellurirhabdus rosea]